MWRGGEYLSHSALRYQKSTNSDRPPLLKEAASSSSRSLRAVFARVSFNPGEAEMMTAADTWQRGHMVSMISILFIYIYIDIFFFFFFFFLMIVFEKLCAHMM